MSAIGRFVHPSNYHTKLATSSVNDIYFLAIVVILTVDTVRLMIIIQFIYSTSIKYSHPASDIRCRKADNTRGKIIVWCKLIVPLHYTMAIFHLFATFLLCTSSS